MSKFFRSANSSGSETGSSDSGPAAEADVSTQDVALQRPPKQSHAGRSHITASGKDWLLHSLLEERCLNQVRAEQIHAGRDDREARKEASRRYRALVTRLAPLNLVSAGLEDDRHGTIRQSVRDILDSVELDDSQVPQAVARISAHAEGQNGAPAVPLRRMLTEGNTPTTPPSLVATMLFDSLGMIGQPAAMTRYSSDFVELGRLGKGGYGEVFHVRHHLDQREYAVKKVLVRPTMLSRMLAEGKRAMDEVLAEIQTLSKLDHPNIVRYFSSWMEISGPDASFIERSDLDFSSDRPKHGVNGAEVSTTFSDSLHGVRPASNDLTDDIFESHSQRSNTPSVSVADVDNGVSSSPSVTGAELETLDGPTLTLHMQMDVYPMTLADFIAPKASGSGILPLSHCFHWEMSIRILLAILHGVEYLHSEGIVHRDLKPANIFLKHEEHPRATHTVDLLLCSECRQAGKSQPAKLSVRIGDFGLVADLAAQPGTDAFPSVAGTELYRPKTMSVGPQLDIHAAGVIACELLCRFETQMERRETLHKLRDGCLPDRFTTCAETQSTRVKSCIAAMLALGEEQMPIGEIKHMLSLLIAPQALDALR